MRGVRQKDTEFEHSFVRTEYGRWRFMYGLAHNGDLPKPNSIEYDMNILDRGYWRLVWLKSELWHKLPMELVEMIGNYMYDQTRRCHLCRMRIRILDLRDNGCVCFNCLQRVY